MSEPKDPLDAVLCVMAQHGMLVQDKELNAFYAGVRHTQAYKEAKQQILTHYISYEEVERLIGEDEKLPQSDIYPAGEIARNQLRGELKAALKKRRESE